MIYATQVTTGLSFIVQVKEVKLSYYKCINIPIILSSEKVCSIKVDILIAKQKSMDAHNVVSQTLTCYSNNSIKI